MNKHAGTDGFTIVELLVAMIIMLVITVPLVSAFVLGIKTTGRGAQDTANSADAQLASLYFETDVASAETVGTTGGCSPVGNTLRLQLQWQDGTETVVIGYSTVANGSSSAQVPVDKLQRHRCSAAGGPVQGTQTLGRALRLPPAFACDGNMCAATNGRPRTVSATVTQAGRTQAEPDFPFTMTAVRRVTP